MVIGGGWFSPVLMIMSPTLTKLGIKIATASPDPQRSSRFF